MSNWNGTDTYDPESYDLRPYDPSSSYALSASAGSGKTFALTTRLLGMLLSGVTPGEILAITFTKLAANEIREGLFSRLKALESGEGVEMEIFKSLLKKDEDFLARRASEIRTSLVERFSSLRVSTIHSFLGSLIGGFPGKEVVFGSNTLPWRIAFSKKGDSPRQITFHQEGYLSELNIIDEQEKRGILGRAFEDFYREIERERDLLNRIFDFVRIYREGRATTEKVIRDIYNTVSQKSFILKDLIDREESESKRIVQEFNARMKGIRSDEAVRSVKLMAEICASYMAGNGENKNLRSFEKILREFIEYRNIKILYGHSAFKRTAEQGLIRYLKTFLDNVGKEQAQRFQRSFERIREDIRLYLSSEMDYYIDSWFEIYRRVQHCYEARKRSRRVVDFDDIGTLALDFLGNLEDFDILDYRLDSKIRYVLIDEFQDTSESQWEALRHIVRKAVASGGNVFYVGDVKQAIYRFRGGTPRLFEDVRIELGIGKRRLLHNYRQNPLLLGFINDVFSRISDDLFPEYEYETQAVSSMTKGRERGYLLVESYQEKEELLSGLLDKVRRLEEGGVSLEDIAVLCRTNREAEEVETLFLSRRIPYRTAGKSLLMNDYAVLDIVNLMKLCTSPGEPVYLAGFLRSPMANFGYEDLRNLAEKDPEDLRNREKSCTLERLYSADRSLADTLGAVVETSRFMLPTETLWHVYERLDPFGCYPGNTEGLLDLMEAAQAFEEGTEVPTLERFVRWLEENSDAIPIKSGAGRGITVQTIHTAKGLEYQTVILPYLSRQFKLKRDGSLVYTRSTDGSIDRYGIARPQYVEWLSEMRGMRAVMDENNREYRIDELNILYVAVTRAKENLIILPLAGRGETVGNVLIRTLDQGIGNAGRYRMSKGGIAPSEEGMPWIEHVYEKYSPKEVEMPQAVRERESVPAQIDIRKRRSGKLKGLLFHKALEMSEHVPPPSEIDGLMRRAMLQVGSVYTEEERRIALESAKRAFIATIADSRLRRYFTPEAMTEVETISWQYTDLIGRADRVVIGETVSVIDFKTDEPGTENNLVKLVNLYAPQVEGYCRSFSNLFPGRPIEGWLYFTEAPFRDRLVKVYDNRES